MMPPPTLSLFSPAKINLFLHIVGQRSDGYHNLQTVFRLLDWGDTLTFSKSNETFDPTQPLNETNTPIELISNIAITSDLTDNLVFKAARALITYRYVNSKHQPSYALANKALSPYFLPVININLIKRLPTGAGLGGGSSNAATTLTALNQLWHLGLSNKTLQDIGASIGADVPIFLWGKDAFAEGIGEQFTPLDLPQQTYLLLNPSLGNPKAHASTQALFAHPDLRRDYPELDSQQVRQQQSKYLYRLEAPYNNVFESVAYQLVPEVAEALNYLKPLASLIHSTARLTGSGSSVFLPIPQQHLRRITDYVQHQHIPPCHYVFAHSIEAIAT